MPLGICDKSKVPPKYLLLENFVSIIPISSSIWTSVNNLEYKPTQNVIRLEERSIILIILLAVS